MNRRLAKVQVVLAVLTAALIVLLFVYGVISVNRAFNDAQEKSAALLDQIAKTQGAIAALLQQMIASDQETVRVLLGDHHKQFDAIRCVLAASSGSGVTTRRVEDCLARWGVK